MVTSDRNERRKAETRGRITRAAESLFEAKGYAATSMEDISVAADVAIRTIYLHFDSKAAVLLASFDDWLDEFVRLVGERSAGEPLDAAVERALATMVADGWNDNRRVEDSATLHPVPESMGGGSPEIAGHVMQRWVVAQHALAESFRSTAGLPPDAVGPRIEAAAVFAAWVATILDFRARHADGTPGGSSHEVGTAAIRAFVRGLGAES